MTADNAIVATLLQLADNHKDHAIADELRRLAVLAEKYPDMPSSAAMQRAIWSAEDAVYQKLDRILALCETNGAVVTEAFAKSVENELAAQQQADRLESALATIAGALQRQEVAVDDLRQGFRAIAEEVSNLTLASIEQERFNRSVEGRVARLEPMVADHSERIAVLEAEHRQIGQQLGDILARLPQDALDREQ